MAKAKLKAVAAERLDPPMTKKERQMVQKYRQVLLAIVGGFQLAEDPGVRNMAMNEPSRFDRLINERVQDYRDGKEE